MKKYLCAAASLLLAIPSLLRADDVLTSDQDKLSYCLGVEMSQNLRDLRKQGTEVNMDAVMEGLKDGVAGGSLKMTGDQMQTTMQTFVRDMQEKTKAKIAENKARGEAYLEENKKKDGWKTTPSGLQYKVTFTGTGRKPDATDTAVTQYRETMIDETELDSTYKRNRPAEFPLDKPIMPGWKEALLMMPVGSKWQLAVPAKLAYGENPPPQSGIWPDTVLLFDVELVAIKKPDTGPGAAPELK